LLAQCWWFSSGTLTSSTTKTGRHDIAEILLKVALNTIKSNQAKNVAPQCGSVAKSNHMLRVLQNMEIVITTNYKLLYIYFQVACVLFYI